MEGIPPGIITKSIESETERLERLLGEAQKRYAEKRIVIELIKNNGKFNNYYNKCILLALRDLLTLYDIEHDLSTYTNFHHDMMFDIENHNHLTHLKNLLTHIADTFQLNLICYFYYVSFEGDDAYVSPEFKVQISSQTNFKASTILRIANYPGCHFEAIVPLANDPFIDEPIDAAHKRLNELQRQLYLSEDRLSISNKTVEDKLQLQSQLQLQLQLQLQSQLQQHQEAEQITKIKEKYPDWIEEIGNFKLSAKEVIEQFEKQKDKLEEDRLTKEYLETLRIDVNEQKTLLMLGNESRK
jgi:hypothetical protein